MEASKGFPPCAVRLDNAQLCETSRQHDDTQLIVVISTVAWIYSQRKPKVERVFRQW
jgi:hypothetical protein